MRCTQCNSELSLGERFCGVCGLSRPGSHSRFISVEEEFLLLKHREQEGRISEDEINAALRKLILTDEEGASWMIGWESGSWHRFNGSDWQPRDPPDQPAEKSRGKVNSRMPASGAAPLKSRSASRPTTGQVEQEGSEIRSSARAPRRGCLGWPSGCRVALGLTLLGLILIGLVLGRNLYDRLLTLAIKQGWGKVAATQNPQEAAPSAAASLHQNNPADPVPVKPTAPVYASWEKGAFPQAGVQVGIPPDLTFNIEEDEYGYFRGINAITGLSMDVQPAQAGGSIESEMSDWLNYQDQVSWQAPQYGSTAVGPMAWAMGTFAEGDPVFTALAGPTRDGHLLTFWGLGEKNDQERWAVVFQQVVASLDYMN